MLKIFCSLSTMALLMTTLNSCSDSDSTKNAHAIHFGPGPGGYQENDNSIAEAP